MTELSAARQHNADDNWLDAEVCYIELEGGFFGLLTNDGKRLLPLNLPKAFCKPGAKVKLRGHEQREIMTIQQWGTPFHLTQIEFIDPESNSKLHNPLI
ncbi:hypothetical protein [Pseudoalteromonas sp. T1lg76]|uniref:hypothetical protein n=1 Tax=Pseudoalteromonas sp. T1lg76 TaxID=2077103 RepID=UPI000CF64651|nr:hypothetical protein [Pseudoalteromonas sp. T1lg76]